MNPTFKELKDTHKEILKLSAKLNHVEKKPHVIFVYAGGHGATENEQQYFLLNSNDPKQATFQLEFKLRTMVADVLSMARIFAVYDCSRVPLRNFIGISSDVKGGLG